MLHRQASWTIIAMTRVSSNERSRSPRAAFSYRLAVRGGGRCPVEVEVFVSFDIRLRSWKHPDRQRRSPTTCSAPECAGVEPRTVPRERHRQRRSTAHHTSSARVGYCESRSAVSVTAVHRIDDTRPRHHFAVA